MIMIIAVLCSIASPDDCHEQLVASDGSLQACMFAQPVIAAWMNEHPGYRITKWKCVAGAPSVPA